MEGWMITFIMYFYLSIFIAVLIVIIAVIFFIHKRLGHSSGFRKVLAPLAGIGGGLVGAVFGGAGGSFLGNYGKKYVIDGSPENFEEMKMQLTK